MMNKLVSCFLIICFLCFSGVFSDAENETAMSNADFADLLIRVLYIDMPQGTEDLSNDELFKLQTDLLAEADINVFTDLAPDSLVTKGTVADALYSALHGYSYLTAQEKIDYFVSIGYLPSGRETDVILTQEIIAAFNVPELSQRVVEPYTPAAKKNIAPPARVNPASETAVSPV